MSLSDVFENAVLNLVYRAVAWANVADNAATSPITNTYSALHTADPGDAGTQATSEVTYTGYARTAVARTTGGWGAASGGVISPAAAITFPQGTGGSGTATFFSQGKTVSGATDAYHSGSLTPSIVTGNGVTPQLSTASTLSLDSSWIATIVTVWLLTQMSGGISWLASLAGIQ